MKQQQAVQYTKTPPPGMIRHGGVWLCGAGCGSTLGPFRCRHSGNSAGARAGAGAQTVDLDELKHALIEAGRAVAADLRAHHERILKTYLPGAPR